ncbi:MAG TPA: energy-coupling factor ABC transporter permease, partial [Thiobacillus sp.]
GKKRVEETTSTSFAADLKKWLQIMQAYEGGGHAYHATMPTGALALTLMFGFWRATFAGVLVLLANAAFGRGSWAALGVNALLTAALPAAVSWGVFRLVDRWLPNHFFVYVLGNGFFGAALSMAVVGLATTAVMAAASAYPLDYLLANYTPYALLLSWAEAFSTGMAVTVMAVYRPRWLETFDDVKYLHNK